MRHPTAPAYGKRWRFAYLLPRRNTPMSDTLRQSPPLLVNSDDDIDTDAGQAKLVYFVAIFNASRRNFSKADIVITGNRLAAEKVRNALVRRHGVLDSRIVVDDNNVKPGGRDLELVIFYNQYSTPKRVKVSF